MRADLGSFGSTPKQRRKFPPPSRAFSDEVDAGSSTKMRPINKLERISDSIGSKSALVRMPLSNGNSVELALDVGKALLDQLIRLGARHLARQNFLRSLQSCIDG